MRVTEQFFTTALQGIADALPEFHITYFAGPVPATAGEALNMADNHTRVALLTDGGDGTSPLRWGAATGSLLPLDSSVDAYGLVVFSGAEQSLTTLEPKFFRIHEAGDDPTSAAAGSVRIQGSLGGQSSGADIELFSTTVTSNGSNTIGLSGYSISASSIGG